MSDCESHEIEHGGFGENDFCHRRADFTCPYPPCDRNKCPYYKP